MKKTISVTIFFIIFCFSTGYILPKEKFIIDKFEKYINKSMKEWKVPGIAVGIMNRGYIILAKGYGFRNVEKKLPVTRYTMFPIGSATKAFTSFVIGKLSDEKLLNWNDPVKKYLPSFELYDPWVTEHFRVTDLLIHNSGLPRHDLTWYGSDKSREELFNGIKYLKNNKGFREVFQYQNLMFMTAGYLAGKVKVSSWEELVRSYIFRPIEMENSNFSIEQSEKTDNYALPYIEKNGKIEEIPFYRKIVGIGPAGAINSNIYEMLKWVKLQLDNGVWKGKEIISKNNLKKIHTPHIVAGETIVRIFEKFPEISYPTYGFGWFINHYRGHNLLHHGGNINGFSALVSFMPDINTGIVILTNKGGNLLTYATIFHIYDKLLGIKPVNWNGRFKKVLEERKNKKIMEAKKMEKDRKSESGPHDLFSLLDGKYVNPAYGELMIFNKDKSLFIKFHDFESSLKHLGGNEFTIEKGIAEGMIIKFIKNPEKKIVSVSAPLEPKVADIIFTKKGIIPKTEDQMDFKDND